MPHFDPERLALVALGEPFTDPEEALHLEGCRRCRAELEELTHAAQVGRASIDGTLETPSPRVWQRIAGELGFESAADYTGLDHAPVLELAPATRRSQAPEAPTRAQRRSAWVWVLAAAAAVVLVIGAAAGITALVRPSVTQLASATLDALPDWTGSVGSAEIDERADGSRVLSLSLETSADASGYREVWLMTPDASGLISLGLLAGDRGDFVIPQNVDLDEFRLVDVSAEPTDGDPTHSGDSIVRGQLQFS